MVNFRYHLVTITAIFLALAAGIVLGITVGDPAGNSIKDQLTKAQAVAGQNAALNSELGAWKDFGVKAAPGLFAGRLADVPVLLVGVRGADTQLVKTLRDNIGHADAQVLGTIWMTSKLKLERSEDVAALAALLDLQVLDPAQVRSAALTRLARQLAAPDRPRPTSTSVTSVPATAPAGGATTSSVATAETTTTTAVRATRTTLLSSMIAAGFLDADDPPGGKLDPQVLLPDATRFVVLSAQEVDVPDDLAAIPFVKALADASGTEKRTIAVEPGRAPKAPDPGERSAFIGPLRSTSKDLDGAVATVNNIEDFRGQAAVVLALADLGLGRVGHYGVGSGADRLVPEAG
jgi:hypothetical protein